MGRYITFLCVRIVVFVFSVVLFLRRDSFISQFLDGARESGFLEILQALGSRVALFVQPYLGWGIATLAVIPFFMGQREEVCWPIAKLMRLSQDTKFLSLLTKTRPPKRSHFFWQRLNNFFLCVATVVGLPASSSRFASNGCANSVSSRTKSRCPDDAYVAASATRTRRGGAAAPSWPT